MKLYRNRSISLIIPSQYVERLGLTPGEFVKVELPKGSKKITVEAIDLSK